MLFHFVLFMYPIQSYFITYYICFFDMFIRHLRCTRGIIQGIPKYLISLYETYFYDKYVTIFFILIQNIMTLSWHIKASIHHFLQRYSSHLWYPKKITNHNQHKSKINRYTNTKHEIRINVYQIDSCFL